MVETALVWPADEHAEPDGNRGMVSGYDAFLNGGRCHYGSRTGRQAGLVQAYRELSRSCHSY